MYRFYITVLYIALERFSRLYLRKIVKQAFYIQRHNYTINVQVKIE